MSPWRSSSHLRPGTSQAEPLIPTSASMGPFYLHYFSPLLSHCWTRPPSGRGPPASFPTPCSPSLSSLWAHRSLLRIKYGVPQHLLVLSSPYSFSTLYFPLDSHHFQILDPYNIPNPPSGPQTCPADCLLGYFLVMSTCHT